MKKLIGLVFVGLFVLASVSLAQEGKTPTEISGVIFADYFYNLTEGVAPAARSCFEVPRLYISASRALSDKIKLKATLEGAQPANTLWVKNAFIEFSDVLPGQNVRGGVIGTPWIGYEEKIWRYRFVAKTFTDIEGVLPPADNGVGINGKLAGKLVDYDFNVINGEGYKTAEVSENKDFAARVSVEPVAGAKVHAYQQIGHAGTAGTNRDRAIIGVSYEQKAYSAMAYYLAEKDIAVDKSGYSVFGSYNLLSWLSALGRLDSYDSDTSTPNNSWQRIIFGVSTKVSDDVQIALDYQVKNFENTTVQGNNQSMITTHLGIKY